MKFSTTLAALSCAGPSMAVPFSFFGNSGASAQASGNVVGSVMTDLLNGGNVASGCNKIAGDDKLADHVLDLVKSGSFANQTAQLWGNADFRGQVKGLVGNDDFLNQITTTLGKGNFFSQCAKLAGNQDVLNTFVTLAGNGDLLSEIKADFGADFDLAAGIESLSGYLQSPQLMKLITNVAGGQGSVTNKIQALLSDNEIVGKITGLLKGEGSFGAGLAGLLKDTDFVTKVGKCVGLDSGKIKSLIDLFGSANFGAHLEGMLGGKFSGLAGLIGGGDITSIFTKCFGGKGFISLVTDLFANTQLFASIGGLFNNGGFVKVLTGSLSGLFCGKLDFSAFLNEIKGQTSFLTQICGVFGLNLSSLTSCLSIFQKGFSGFFSTFKSMFGF